MASVPAAPRTESGWGAASLYLSLLPYAAAVLMTLAALLGVRDNQGYVYAFTVPFFFYVTSTPVAALMAIGAFLQRGRRHVCSLVALALIGTPAVGFAIYAIAWGG